MLFKQKDIPEIDIKTVNQIRCLGLDIINEAGSGHSGIVLGAAPIIYTLYSKHLNFNPNDVNWVNRDRFIMSSGHGSALLYATLYMAGFNITIDDLKSFRQIDSITPGHPEYGVTPGVDLTTGMLGNGFATSIGFAIAETYLNAYFKSKGNNLIDHYTYVMVGDGDLMEGVSSEAISLAGTLKLNKLIVLYDNNNVSLDGNCDITFTENVPAKFISNGWEVIEVGDSEDLTSIDKAITKAKESDKPTLISVKTTIGKFGKFEGTNLAHGNKLSDEDILEIKKKLGVREIPFAISTDVIDSLREEISERVKTSYEDWQAIYQKIDDKFEIDKIISGDLSINLTNPDIEFAREEPLRDSLSKVLNMINDPLFIGGSCDVSSSCNTYLDGVGDYSSKNRLGRNMFFGVREHLSSCIINGLLLNGIRCFTSTYLAFSDYMRPGIRMSAIMNLPAIYIFTHDSVTIGEDGPTHSPVEQLDSLRLIPGVDVYRPADMNEVIGVFKNVLLKKEGVSIISITKNMVPLLDDIKISDVATGGYVLRKSEIADVATLIASGEEVSLALKLQERLLVNGIGINVISMPSISIFDEQSDEYKNSVLNSKNIFSLEASTSLSYLKYTGSVNNLINIKTFGFSGKRNDVLTKLNYDIDSIQEYITKMIK